MGDLYMAFVREPACCQLDRGFWLLPQRSQGWSGLGGVKQPSVIWAEWTQDPPQSYVSSRKDGTGKVLQPHVCIFSGAWSWTWLVICPSGEVLLGSIRTLEASEVLRSYNPDLDWTMEETGFFLNRDQASLPPTFSDLFGTRRRKPGLRDIGVRVSLSQRT